MASGFEPWKVFLIPKFIRNLPMSSSGAFMVSFYTLVPGTGSFSCHFLSSKYKVGPKKPGVWGREGAAMADASRCGALTSFIPSRNPSQETSHFPSCGWVRGSTTLPEERKKSTWPDGNWSCRTRAEGVGEGDGDSDRWLLEEMASELSLKNEGNVRQWWGKRNRGSKGREVGKSAKSLAWREGFSGPWGPPT